MANATKVLTAVNDSIVIGDIDEINGAALIQYGPNGLGTLVLEQSSMDDGATLPVDIWVAVSCIDITTGLPVTSIAAEGAMRGEIVGAIKVRCRKSVAGAGDVRAALSLKNQ